MRLFATAVAACVALSGGAHAADCLTEKEPFDLEADEIVSLYDCMKDAMVAGYTKEGNEIGASYRSWAITSTRPAVAGPHGERLLQTFANDVAAEQYLKFADDGFTMPVGSVLAKESLAVRKGTMRVGPLFLMTKVGVDEAPETDGWLYGGVQPNGKNMRFKQSFCHDCHSAWEDSDSLAYPLEEVRISN